MSRIPPSGMSFRRIDDYDAIRELSLRAGLDVADKPVDDIVTAFGYYIDGRLMGSAALEREDGHLFLEWVAVDSSERGKGVGAALVALVEGDARARGMTQLWAKARVPEFYKKIGFRVVGEGERAPKSLDGCDGCPQFRTSCNPAIVVRELHRRSSVF